MYNDQEKAMKYLIVGAGMIAIIFGRPVRSTVIKLIPEDDNKWHQH